MKLIFSFSNCFSKLKKYWNYVSILFQRSYKIITGNYCDCHKYRQNHNQQFLYQSKEDPYSPKYLSSFFTLSKSKQYTNLQKQPPQKVFQCVCCKCNLLWWMFFIRCDNWKTLFFIKFHLYFEISIQPLHPWFFETSVLKEDVFYEDTLRISSYSVSPQE